MRYPVYIPTRGRPEQQLTANVLLSLGIKPTLVVEDAEHDTYAKHNPDCDVIVWPTSYMHDYEKTPELDPHPTTGAAHNYAWDHSREQGYARHWIMDDNIKRFYHRRNGKQHQTNTIEPFTQHEQLSEKYANLAGLSLGQGHTYGDPPFRLNTRLYCATLYRNDLHEWGIRWRRGLNDDTIVSLDILKTHWWCTAESHMLLIIKTGTSRKTRMQGGMTDFYASGGFARKAAEAIRCHPDCVKTSTRFGRIHHHIDYRQFTQKLIPTG